MALWQYSFFVLPDNGYQFLEAGMQLKLSDENFDDAPFWKSKHLTIDYFDDISNFLPRGKSWHKNLVVFGDLESHCIEIITENEEVVSVSFRIDFQSNYKPLLVNIIEFCLFRSLVILDENLRVLHLDINQIAETIESSSQRQKLIRLKK